MRKYEFTVIAPVDAETLSKAKEFLAAELKANNVTITKEEDMGVRELAYPIKKEEKGNYLYYELEADPAVIEKIEAPLRLSTMILKYLFVKKG